MSGWIATTTAVHFTDMTAGDRLELSAEFHFGVGGAHGINMGVSEQVVQADGTIQFAVLTHALTDGHAGTARFWLRPVGSAEDAPPVDDVNGHPALTHGLHIP